jgi:hypothetical protein
MAVDMLIKTQSGFARLMAIEHVDSERDETAGSDSHRESSKPSEIAMYIEMGIALVAVFSILAMAACVWYAASHDWASSIQRFQEMI